MTTKFVLHGGFDTEKSVQENDLFFLEILKNTNNNLKILLVYFAKDIDSFPKIIDRNIIQFTKNKGNKFLFFQIAEENLFLDQITQSDIIYFNGGRSKKILEILKKFPDLKLVFKGKVIAGDSAGANILSKYFYSPSSDNVFEGLGILPIKLIPHYREDYKGKLDSVGEDLELLLLPEYKFKVFEVNLL
jgi:peptidase E